MKFLTYRMFQSSRRHRQDSQTDANFTMTLQLSVNLTLVKASAPMLSRIPLPGTMPMMTFCQRRLRIVPMIRQKIAVVNRDDLEEDDVAEVARTMEIDPAKLKDHRRLIGQIPKVQQIERKGQRRRKTSDQQGRQHRTDHPEVNARHEVNARRETIAREIVRPIETNEASGGQTVPADRKLLQIFATSLNPLKTSDAVRQTPGTIKMSLSQTKRLPKALIPSQNQEPRRAMVGLVARVVAAVVEGRGQKVAVSEQQRTSRREFV